MATRSAKPGSGKKFAKLVRSLEARGYSECSARAIAASAGRAKYGNRQMAKWAAEGRRRRHRNPRERHNETGSFASARGTLIILGVAGAALGAAYFLTKR